MSDWFTIDRIDVETYIISEYRQHTATSKTVTCPVYVIGSEADTTLSASLQKKVAECFSNSKLRVFENVSHGNYLVTEEVIEYIKTKTD